MQAKKDEKRVVLLLKSLGFSSTSFTKKERQKSKTPDFKVYSKGKFQFYCEVKTIIEDSWRGGARNDPIFNRLTNDIHEAIKQFDSVNAKLCYPNVLVFVNHDEMCRIDDLISIITGDFFADNGKRYPIYRQFSNGRIKSEKKRIHLFIWVDGAKPPRFLFNQERREFYIHLCALFNKDPEKIKKIALK